VTGFGRRRGKKSAPLAEINITPFTDVVLVLLIIFMVSASFLGVNAKGGMNVNLPSAKSTEPTQPGKELEIIVTKANAVSIDGSRVAVSDLPGALNRLRKQSKVDLVIIKADQAVVYDRIVKVMDAVKLAGLDKIALATEVQPVSAPGQRGARGRSKALRRSSRPTARLDGADG
jgi:biopolymer transport protein TolR